MALNLPSSAAELESRSKTDVQRELPGSNPFLKNSVLGAIVVAASNRIFDFYLQLKAALNVLFPDTTEGVFLDRWAAIYGKTRLAATTSTGNIVSTGVATTAIPIGTTWTSTDGNLYDSTSNATISAQSLSVTSLTRVASTATATTVSNHNLASNVPVTISGADQSDFNVINAVITVTGLTTFTYAVANNPTTPATGTVLAGFTSASVPVISQAFQDSTNDIEVNLESGSPLSIQSPLVGVDSESRVDFADIGGGTDQESDTGLRTRFIEIIQNPVAHFSAAEITAIAKEIAGVTRVFVLEITPLVGQVTVYFMRDNDVNPIPSASEVTTVKDQILTITPANTDPDDLIVLAPTAVPTDFTFTAMTPNTVTMQDAVTASLSVFFSTVPEVGIDVDEDAYRAAISNTIDTSTGDQISTFSLSTPSGDITITSGEIATLGNLVYP